MTESYEPTATPVTIAVAVQPANDGDALLREAERAFAAGRHATALLYADRSRATSPDPRAVRIAALAACHLGKASKAASAYLALAVAQRASVRNACRARGLDLGTNGEVKPVASSSPTASP